MQTPNREIELKFELAAGDEAAVLAALPAGEDRRQSLRSVYYDTADQILARRGLGLRVRQSGEGFIQTLKSEAGADGGRDEWEWPVASLTPDPDRLAGTPGRLPQDAALEARFTVEVERWLRLVGTGDVVEVALDAGRVVADGRERRFVELELELKAGAPAALFALAGRLLEAAPLTLSFVTKAERGGALLAGDPPGGVAYRPPALELDIPAGQALQAIGRACLAQLAANAAGLRRTPGPEGVHQLRVALRRLRSTLSSFANVAADGDLPAVKAELEWLTGALGPARNLDVLLDEVWRPAAEADHGQEGLAAFGAVLMTAQAEAYRRAVAAIESPRFRRLMLATAGWLQHGPWTAADAPAAALRDGPARDLARKVLDRRRRQVLRRARHPRDMTPVDRHHLRIQAKKLRYAAEDLGPLFPDHPRRRERFIARLKTLQDALGGLNDLTVGAALAEDLARKAGDAAAAWAAGRLTGDRAATQAGLLKAARRACEALSDARPFW